VVDAARG